MYREWEYCVFTSSVALAVYFFYLFFSFKL